MSIDRLQPPLDVREVTLICVTCARGGSSERDYRRTAYFYYTRAGELVACYDPINGPPDYFAVPAADPTGHDAE